MNAETIINTIAEQWIEMGGDSEGFCRNWSRITEAIRFYERAMNTEYNEGGDDENTCS